MPTNLGSVADWVSGLGSMGAVIVAVGLAIRETRRSGKEAAAMRLSLAFAVGEIALTVADEARSAGEAYRDRPPEAAQDNFKRFLEARANATDVLGSINPANVLDPALLVIFADARRTVLTEFITSSSPQQRSADLFALADRIEKSVTRISDYMSGKLAAPRMFAFIDKLEERP